MRALLPHITSWATIEEFRAKVGVSSILFMISGRTEVRGGEGSEMRKGLISW